MRARTVRSGKMEEKKKVLVGGGEVGVRDDALGDPVAVTEH